MNKINTRKALNPAYRKHKPLRREVNHFIMQLEKCIDKVKRSDENGESEEHIKVHFRTFFKNTFYKDNYVNTKDKIDLAIYLGDTAQSNAGVLIEVKRPSNETEFLKPDNLNKKALQELLLYYLRERIDNGNNNIKHLIATNGYEWYLFKSEDFYNYFFKNKALIKEYKAFRDGLKDTSKTELFYNEIAKKYIAKVEQKLPFVHLDFTNTNFDKLKDSDLNIWYKIFSDVHLLGHSFGNDSNQLNTAFYNELLHIIGLEEVKDNGKKVIHRKAEKNRDYGSFLENTLVILEDRGHLSKIKSIPKGEDKAFNAGLELCLTWVNRILFLKLLESQLVIYHQKDEKYKFLNPNFISDFDELNVLFFSALAKPIDERHPKYKDKYKNIPYLNSSLFEKNILENEAFEVSSLNNDEITIYNDTVLKEVNGKRQTGKLSTLKYLFQFLEAYDFATDGSEGIEENHETKTLINASVLGLIFEKINGYKEGSFYTPGFITMYMCRETIRKAVVQKFKEQEESQIETFEDLQSYCSKLFKITDLKRLNAIVNSIKICDPAVGSGHFLVSALNELIVIKNELRILIDAKGIPINCDIEIVNDELYILNSQGELFEYKPKSKESQRIQKTLFHEKQTLIENCLFGVDINPNSVKICRLRLWIELLKNAYYKNEKELETLPNIDINIKCGNALISRFKLNGSYLELPSKTQQEIKQATKEYKEQVILYKCTDNKEVKEQVRKEIERLKKQFSRIANPNDKEYIEIKKIEGELGLIKAFFDKKDKEEHDKKMYRLGGELNKLKKIYDEKRNTIYKNAFEWRFEFPEVLNDKGGFMGFDVIIGNPPYIRADSGEEYLKFRKDLLASKTYKTLWEKWDIYVAFIEKGFNLLRKNGTITFLIPSAYLTTKYALKSREYFIKNAKIDRIDFLMDLDIFDVAVKNIIFQYTNSNFLNYKPKRLKHSENFGNILTLETDLQSNLKENVFNETLKKELNFKNTIQWGEIFYVSKGLVANADENKAKGLFKKADLISLVKNKTYSKPYVEGKDIKAYKVERIRYLEWNTERCPKLISRATFPELYMYPKIMQGGMTDAICDDSGLISNHSITISTFWHNLKVVQNRSINNSVAKDFHVKGKPQIAKKRKELNTNSQKFDIKYCLSILNSKFAKWFFNQVRRSAISLYPDDLKKLPIPQLSKVAQKPFINLVKRMLSKKAKGESTEVEEEKIDGLVYKVYGLSVGEIEIVEKL